MARCWAAWPPARYEREEVRSVDNLMIVVKDVPPGTPPREGVEVAKNVDFATFAKRLAEARKPSAGTAKATVLRIVRPKQAPEFSTDARGFLVALIHDFQIDVPAPENQEKGGFVGAPAKVYRLKVPLAEVSLSYKVDLTKAGAMAVHAKVEDFNPGTDSQVLAIADDESKGVPLSRFSAAFVLGAFGGQLRLKPIDATLDQLKVPGIIVRSISPLDPTGWVTVNLERDASVPIPPVNPPKVQGPPAQTASSAGTVTPVPTVGQRRWPSHQCQAEA